MELYKKYRPASLKELFGQERAVSLLTQHLENQSLPRALLLIGDPGTGKTSTAHILRDRLQCHESDFIEINCASVSSPIDAVREIEQRSRLAPWKDCRIHFLEEVQSLSRATHAQQSMLGLLEFPPPKNYFILATSDVTKLNKALRSRCVEVLFNPLPNRAMQELLSYVATQEHIKVFQETLDAIIEASEGGARKALNMLQMVIGVEEPDQQLAMITRGVPEGEAVRLARLLLEREPAWAEVRKMINNLGEDGESVRRIVYTYMGSVLRNSGGAQAEKTYARMLPFQDAWLDTGTGNMGRAKLAQACYEACRREIP